MVTVVPPPVPVRHAVRRQSPALTAVPVTRDQVVTLPLGTDVLAQVGDWILARGNQVVQVVSPEEFAVQYEAVGTEGLVLRADHRARIERTLGMGSTETPEHLATAIERMGRLVVGDIRIDFTPGQWEHLKHRADKMGLTLDALMHRIVDRISSEIFEHA